MYQDLYKPEMIYFCGVKPVSNSSPPSKKKIKKRKPVGKENFEPRLEEYKPKMFSTLQPYLRIVNHRKFPGMDLYKEFERFLLTPFELSLNNFPIECPDRPGHILTQVKTYHPSPTGRVCSRCAKTYEVEGDDYHSDTNCRYHSGRVTDRGFYTCCGQPSENPCKLSLNHVNTELPLDDLVFKKVDAKRQIRWDQMRKVYALDCEMVYTTIGLEVAKVSLVDIEGKPVYNSLVKPKHPVLDYNTEFSGIRATDLEGLNITFDDVQAFLLKTINKDTILVGHALQNDLRVLRLIHDKIVDTQVVFRGTGKTFRKKLQILAKEYLGKSIQNSKFGHDSVEDARVCMELMLHRIYNNMVDIPKDTFRILKDLQNFCVLSSPPPPVMVRPPSPPLNETFFPLRSPKIVDIVYFKLVDGVGEAGLASALREIDACLSLPDGVYKVQMVNEWIVKMSTSKHSFQEILIQPC